MQKRNLYTAQTINRCLVWKLCYFISLYATASISKHGDTALVAVYQPHDFVEIGNFAQFSEFLHNNGRHFQEFISGQVYVWPL